MKIIWKALLVIVLLALTADARVQAGDTAWIDGASFTGFHSAAATGCFGEGKELSFKDDKAAAIAAYTKAIKFDPQYASAYVNRGNLLADIGDSQGCIAYQLKAISISPHYGFAYNNIGAELENRGDLTGAILKYTH